MKIAKYSNLYFQKKLVAKSKLPCGEGCKDVSIYKLEKDVDRLYFERMRLNDWSRTLTFYLDEIEMDFDCDYYHEIASYYSMEDENKRVLAVAEIEDHGDKENALDYIEVNPVLKEGNPNRKTKFIGETMLAFLNGLTFYQGKEVFNLPTIRKSWQTNNFYFNQCKLSKSEDGAYLKREKMPELMKINEEHTGHKIEYIF